MMNISQRHREKAEKLKALVASVNTLAEELKMAGYNVSFEYAEARMVNAPINGVSVTQTVEVRL